MAQKTAQQMADKWASRMAGAGQAYQDGIGGVTESPTAAAAAKLDKALANYTESITSGRMAAALNGVTLASWKAAAVAGASRLTSGAAKGKPKMLKAQQVLIPYQQQAAAAAKAAGDDPVARFTAAMNVMKSAKGAVKGG